MATKWKYYTIKDGDTLSEIAKKYGTTVAYLASINNISNVDIIKAGDVIKVGVLSEDDKDEGNNTQRAKITNFGLMLGSTREVFAQWTWSKSDTDHYELLWMYGTGAGIGFIGSRTTTTEKQATWSAPENATHVTFQVKPVAKTKKQGDKEVYPWTADWTTKVRYYYSDNPPETPTGLSVTIPEGSPYTLRATLDNLDINADQIEFQVVQDDTKLFATGKSNIKLQHAEHEWDLIAGHSYKVRCRGVRDGLHSEWSEYSSAVQTPPPTTHILELRALSETKIYMDWEKRSGAQSYEIEYTTKKSNFDSGTEKPTSHTVDAPLSHAEIVLSETGTEWFFRVRVRNAAGESLWSPIVSIVIGTTPEAPTTWSSVTVASVGEKVTLYWVHNSEDASKETKAILELNIDGDISQREIEWSKTIIEKDETRYCELNTGDYKDGCQIKWRVRTKGAIDKFGAWSVQRTIDVYAPPVVSIRADDAVNGLESFPLDITIESGPTTQDPIGYHLSIVAGETYEDVDRVGNPVTISEGDTVYSKYINTDKHEYSVSLTAADVSLRNNVNYYIVCSVAMDSGLSGSSEFSFPVAWSDDIEVYPNAELAYDEETYSMNINPYCRDVNEELIDGVLLSVYRREFDGSFTEIMANIENTGGIFVTDPHPSLDFARYRIVARVEETGLVSYYDMPAFFIGEPGIIIQWNEDWHTFDATGESQPEQPGWTGSLLRLPFNVDISESNTPDVSLVNYIGREHPVSYYGTHLGQTGSWSAVIDSTDIETIYAIRRLARWMGDVYVREPSGNGYWANITIPFSQKHKDVVTPISINVTRVDGGV